MKIEHLLLETLPRGQAFTVDRIITIIRLNQGVECKRTSLSVVLSNMVRENKIERVRTGFYLLPEKAVD